MYDNAGNLLSRAVTGISNLKGDVNADGELTLADAVESLKVQAGFNMVMNLPADVNGDGKIGLPESVYVLQNEAD